MDRDVITKERFSATTALLARFSTPSSRVVEIGSTDASFAKHVAHATWETVDKFGNPDHIADLDGDLAHLPFADDSVDLILCTEVLEHLTAGSQLVEEMARTLTPQGRAIVSVPNIASLKCRLRLALGKVPSMAASGDCGPPLGGTGVWAGGRWVAGHVVDYNWSRLEEYLARGGLTVTDRASVPVGLGQYGRGPLRGRSVKLPRTLADFVLVAARPR